jgi:hypothetical protein
MGPLFQCGLKKLIDQLLDGSAVGDTARESTKIDDVVSAGGETLGTVATPQTRISV